MVWLAIWAHSKIWEWVESSSHIRGKKQKIFQAATQTICGCGSKLWMSSMDGLALIAWPITKTKGWLFLPLVILLFDSLYRHISPNISHFLAYQHANKWVHPPRWTPCRPCLALPCRPAARCWHTALDPLFRPRWAPRSHRSSPASNRSAFWVRGRFLRIKSHYEIPTKKVEYSRGCSWEFWRYHFFG